jgi:hypothetical protein
MSSLPDDHESKMALIMRQTNYDEKCAFAKLVEHSYDCDQVVREYLLGGVHVAQAPPNRASTNQRVFAEIRGYMDNNVAAFTAKGGSGSKN